MTTEVTPETCDTYLEESIGFIDAAIQVLSQETAFGYNVVSRQLKEIKRSIKEAQGDLHREIERHGTR